MLMGKKTGEKKKNQSDVKKPRAESGPKRLIGGSITVRLKSTRLKRLF